MKTFTLIIITLFSLFAPTKISGQNDKELVTISMYESRDKGYNKIQVHENEKLVQQIDLGLFSYEDLGVHQTELNKVLLKYKNAGYKITSSVRGNISIQTAHLVLITTYTLEKPN